MDKMDKIDMRKVNPDYLLAVSELANNCPYFRLLSMKILSLSPGSALMEVEMEEKHLQAFGFVHGGVFASIIDTAAFWSAFCELDENVGITSVDLKLNYLAPVRKGKLIARGTRLKLGKTLGLGEADIRSEDGKLIAQGTSTLIVLPGFGFANGSELPPKFL
jgi:uncharacterized protein (TIGR00369 family)